MHANKIYEYCVSCPPQDFAQKRYLWPCWPEKIDGNPTFILRTLNPVLVGTRSSVSSIELNFTCQLQFQSSSKVFRKVFVFVYLTISTLLSRYVVILGIQNWSLVNNVFEIFVVYDMTLQFILAKVFILLRFMIFNYL